MRVWTAGGGESRCSQFDARRSPFFEALLDEAEELAGHHAVDDAMVEAQAHVHHVADGDPVADDDGPAHYRFRGEDGGLGLVDDRLRRDRTGRARVVEGERASLYVVGLELLVARAAD